MANVPQFIDSNIPDSTEELKKGKNQLWTIINYIPGLTLMRILDNGKRDETNLQPIDSIRFCRELLQTVKCLHSKGIIHRDIKPANIIIECDKHEPNRICRECKLILIDYGLAYIRTETTDTSSEKFHVSQAEEYTLTNLQEDMGHTWSRVVQMAKLSDTAVRQMTEYEKYEKKGLRRSPTIDASGVCAILFTLLTKEHPGSTRTAQGVQPHHRYARQIQSLAVSPLSNTGKRI